MDTKYKTFHFQEQNFFINFPIEGNAGKFLDYNVVLVEEKQGSTTHEKRLKLRDILETSEVEENYPHSVGYFKMPWGDGTESKIEYLEIREIRTIDDFLHFLISVNL